MPRRAKGPRLYFRRGRRDSRTGKPLPDVWFIRDGATERSTGCGYDRLPEAEAALAQYIASKWTAPPTPAQRRRDPAEVLVDDVLALYAQERAPKTGDPKFVAGNILTLLAWWSGKPLSDVKRSTCKAYVTHRTSLADRRYKDAATAPRVSSETARRELEDLSAAIGYWHGEDTLTTRPVVWLPDKPESPRDALRRPQAARLLRAALGHRARAEGGWTPLARSARANRAHLRRFILIGLYTGTRHTVIRRLLWEESLNQPWVDLEAGVIYRRGRSQREQRTKKTPVVKLPRALVAHMRRWRAADRRLELRLRENDPTFRLVSVIHHGAAPLAGKIRTGFEGCVRDAGLPAEVTPHWLRHTAATWLMERGVDIWQAAGYLGMSPATLIKHYGHHRPDYQEGAAGRGRRPLP